ncbi:uncharacterized mitochondrial protein AtMg00240-like [Lycium barbarum]|uniref:uncharacterized mitochondrial protein AtMg00240-like n=1 Tax=Lycium barbarum TaxID=112863 RepID=UPI00293EF0B6|nr:uncharacterized mitochondrial protein AtMg00240-like [Lycium barbarum]
MHQRKYSLELISEDPLPTHIAAYQRLIEKLLYLTVTRPDIAFGVQILVQTLSQYLQQPKKTHMNAALRIVRYITAQPGQCVLMSSKPIQTMSVYCDVDWAACRHTRISVSRFLVKLGESLVSWKFKK